MQPTAQVDDMEVMLHHQHTWFRSSADTPSDLHAYLRSLALQKGTWFDWDLTLHAAQTCTSGKLSKSTVWHNSCMMACYQANSMHCGLRQFQTTPSGLLLSDGFTLRAESLSEVGESSVA